MTETFIIEGKLTLEEIESGFHPSAIYVDSAPLGDLLAKHIGEYANSTSWDHHALTSGHVYLPGRWRITIEAMASDRPPGAIGA